MEKIENLLTMVQEINAYNGGMEYLEVYDMEMFNEIMSGFEPMDIALKIYFGNFNPNDEYFRFNGYANLESLSDYDLKNELLDYENEIINEYNIIKEEGVFKNAIN